MADLFDHLEDAERAQGVADPAAAAFIRSNATWSHQCHNPLRVDERLRTLDQLLRMRRAAQEGEVGAAVQFSVEGEGVSHGKIL